jgi:hypothetical protein
MFPKKIRAARGILILTGLTLLLYWQYYLLGKIPMPADTIIGAYFPWLDYKWGFPVGVPVKNALISDVFSQFFVWKYLAVQIYKSGNIPFWNTTSLSGTPLMATYHSSVFNPFNVFLFLPKYYGWGIYISLQTFSALLGMYLFLGLYVKNIWARIFGAFVFALSGLMTTWVEFGTGVWAASMLPFGWMNLPDQLAVGLVALERHGQGVRRILLWRADDAQRRGDHLLAQRLRQAAVYRFGGLWGVFLSSVGWSAGSMRPSSQRRAVA